MDPRHRYLETLHAATDAASLIGRDPVQFAHRYPAAEDAELAAFVAAALAFGRVDLFLPVLQRIFDVMDQAGGPRAFVEGFDDPAVFDGIAYRWVRSADLGMLMVALRRVLAEHGSMEALFAGDGPLKVRLARAVEALRGSLGAPLSRGTAYLMSHPAGGSACKRWHLYLRWMVRPPTEGIDRGLWTAVRPAELIVPLDTHVARIARLVGLTARHDASWRTAEDVTACLRQFDPADPVRFDFALAHLGISGGCRARWEPEICPRCAIRPICVEGSAP